MEVQGTIKTIGETQTFGSNGFRKRDLVITTDEQYPQHILVEFVQDKCDLLDAYKTGQNVKVYYNLNGREWVNPQGKTKYFNSIQCWRIEVLNDIKNVEQAAKAIDKQIPPMTPKDAFEPVSNLKEGDNDNLPF